MRQRHFFLLTIFVAGILCYLLISLFSASRREGRYTIGDLGITETPSCAVDINNQGQVLVWHDRSLDTVLRNEDTVSDIHSYVVDASGTKTEIAGIGGSWVKAYAINNLGQVVGNLEDPYRNARVFIWSASDGTSIAGDLERDVGRIWGIRPDARGIDDRGEVLGRFRKMNLLTIQYSPSAFVWSATNGARDIESDLGENNLHDFNGAGDFVGGRRNGFIWSATQGQTSLGRLGQQWSVPLGVNNLRQVVGHSSVTGRIQGTVDGLIRIVENRFQWFSMQWKYRPHAFLWEDGRMVDLNDLVGSSGWELLEAHDINDHGQIVGCGRFKGELRAFLLTPKKAKQTRLE